MSKAVLISIQPKWCELIASGKKTVEVRKTRPKIETPFKCYIYCSDSGKDIFYNSVYSYDDVLYTPKHKEDCKKRLAKNGHLIYNRKVIAEFICDKIVSAEEGSYFKLKCQDIQLSADDLLDYANGKTVYGWHISNLIIYDFPKHIFYFCKPCDRDPQCDCNYCIRYSGNKPILRPPQSWCYVEEVHDERN